MNQILLKTHLYKIKIMILIEENLIVIIKKKINLNKENFQYKIIIFFLLKKLLMIIYKKSI